MKPMPDYRPENGWFNHKANLLSKGVEDSFGMSLAFNLDNHIAKYGKSNDVAKLLSRLYRNVYNGKSPIANGMLKEFCLAANEILNEGTK